MTTALTVANKALALMQQVISKIMGLDYRLEQLRAAEDANSKQITILEQAAVSLLGEIRQNQHLDALGFAMRLKEIETAERVAFGDLSEQLVRIEKRLCTIEAAVKAGVAVGLTMTLGTAVKQ